MENGLLLVVDGHSLINRAYYALSYMRTSRGVPTGGIFGFLSTFYKVVDEYSPTHAAVAFDVHEKTFRHLKYDHYKEGRHKMPDELLEQVPILMDLLNVLGIPVITCPGFEADDILGTLSANAESEGMDALLLTGDRDALQLISPRTNVLLMRTRNKVSETVRYDSALLMEDYSITPSQVIDLKSLMGDASDNIPGIAGIGEKTAMKLLGEFGTVEAALDGWEAVSGAKLKASLRDGREEAMLSKELATIDRAVPVDIHWDEMRYAEPAGSEVSAMLAELELRSFLGRVKPESTVGDAEPEKAAMRTISDAVSLLEWIQGVKDCKGFSLTHSGENIQITPADGEETDIRLRQGLINDGIETSEAYSALAPLFEGGAGFTLVDGKSFMTLLAEYDTGLKHLAFDVMIAGYLLDSTAPDYKLDRLLQQYGAGSLAELERVMRTLLAERDMAELFDKVELPLVRVLFEMQQEGFTVDKASLMALGEVFRERMNALERDIYGMAGHEFNILSPKQLGVVLFEEMGLPAAKKNKTGYSTDVEVLEQLGVPIADAVLEYRQNAKLKSTYVDGISSVMRDGRVHSLFHQAVTATGRLSSAEPNLQNIPVRTPIGREIRKVFHSRGEDWRLIDADYSQIELRILAHCSKDARMIEAFEKGQDIHRRTAAEVNGVPMEAVTDEMRSHAKAVNFGIVYGISDFGLARNTGLTRREAKDFIDRYFAAYPGVKRYMQEAVELGKEQGYVKTLLGRRRYMPELKSSNYNQRSFGERVAMNMPIQGTAADIIKLAMVNIARSLKNGGFEAKLILNVHDELIFDAPISEVEAVKLLAKDAMEGAFKLDVPLVADIGVGRTWYDAK